MITVNFSPTFTGNKGILVIGYSTDGQLSLSIDSLGHQLHNALSNTIKNNRFKGEIGENIAFESPCNVSFDRLLLVGLGKSSTLTTLEAEKIGAAIGKEVQVAPLEIVTLALSDNLENQLLLAHIVYGFQLRLWCFNKYKTKIIPTLQMQQINVICKKNDELQSYFLQLKNIADGVLLAREVISEPANVLSPAVFAQRAQELSKLDIKVTVLDEKQLRERGFNALLAVSQGSAESPYVVSMEWRGDDCNQPPIAFVGKGVCFDSGGISIKPALNMHEMKWDMAGAGAVLGLMHCVAANKMPINVVGVVGLVENMPDGKAQRPGDIIKSLSGQTIEVIDTDAEGRLVLADCLWYTQDQFKPKMMIDLATLTIETIASLAHSYAGLFSNNENLARKIIQAGNISGEEVWQLPMGYEFAKQIESDYADMKNIGEAYAGENGAAAEFLKCFVNDVPWAHLDIAGVAWSKEDTVFAKKGITGYGVRLLEHFIKDLLIDNP